MVSPFFILFSLIFLNLNTVVPFTIKVLFVSLNSSNSWYNFSSISANLSVLKQDIGYLFIFWSVDIKVIAKISLRSINFLLFLFFSFCNSNFNLFIWFSFCMI